MSRDQGLAVMRAARERGINFLDDARYDDETGTAPIPSGYSEVLFGAGSSASAGPVASELRYPQPICIGSPAPADAAARPRQSSRGGR